MAITYKGGNRLAGLSSDTKPTADGEHINGSTFIETDTGKEYILNYGDWTETNQPADCLAELLSDHSGSDQQMRCWDFFCGQDLVETNGWTEKTSGAGSISMADEVDGGLFMTSTASGYQIISFGDVGADPVRQYDGANSTFITTVKHTPNNTGYSEVGFHENPASAGQYYLIYIYPTSNTYVRLQSNGASSAHLDLATLANSIDWHTYKCESKGSEIKVSVDGVLEGTQSTAAKVPSAKLMPYVSAAYANSGTGNTNIRYFEAMNT